MRKQREIQNHGIVVLRRRPKQPLRVCDFDEDDDVVPSKDEDVLSENDDYEVPEEDIYSSEHDSDSNSEEDKYNPASYDRRHNNDLY
jgi:hypothetical protein